MVEESAVTRMPSARSSAVARPIAAASAASAVMAGVAEATTIVAEDAPLVAAEAAATFAVGVPADEHPARTTAAAHTHTARRPWLHFTSLPPILGAGERRPRRPNKDARRSLAVTASKAK
jgi:hypothetical protein